MKKFIFIEPYVSYGGHNYKHLTVIPATFERLGYDYFFYAEDIPEPPFSNEKVAFSLSPVSDIKGLNKFEYINKRSTEFKKIVMAHTGATFVFLTTLEEDFPVWMSLICDDSFREIVKANDSLIVVQSTAGLYRNMLYLSDEEKKALDDLNRNLFWGQYTDLQAIIGNELVPEMNFIECLLPIYDFFIPENMVASEDKYYSYIGRFDIGKGPHQILPALKAFPDKDFFLHFYPVTQTNFLFYLEVLKNASEKIRMYNGLLARDEYADSLTNARLGLLPYDSYEYSIRATGVLEEYILNEVPVIVPKDSWLDYIVNENEGGAVVFDEMQADGIVDAINDAESNFAELKEKVRRTAASFKARMRADAFVERMDLLNKTRNVDVEDVSRKKSRYARTLGKGFAHFYVYCASEYMNEGEVQKAEECIQKAMDADADYWKACVLNERMAKTADPKKMAGLYIEGKVNNSLAFAQDLLKQVKSVLPPNDLNELIPLAKLADLSECDELLRFCENDLDVEKVCPDYLHLVSVVYRLKGEFEKAALFLKKFFEEGRKEFRSEKEIFQFLDDLGDLRDVSDKEVLMYLSCLLDKLEETVSITPESLYHIASLRKRFGDSEKALSCFENVINMPSQKRLKSGAYFHIGDIYTRAGKTTSAKKAFESCLNLNPNHQLAQRSLMRSYE